MDKCYPYPNDGRFLYLENDTGEIVLEDSRDRDGHRSLISVALAKVNSTATRSAEDAFDELVEWLKKNSSGSSSSPTQKGTK